MWLQDLTDWLRQKLEQFQGYFNEAYEATVEFFNTWYAQATAWLIDRVNDFIYESLRAILRMAAAMLEGLPVPDFFTGYTLGDLVAGMPPMIHFMGSSLRLGECVGLIGAAFMFRISRKIATLGRW